MKSIKLLKRAHPTKDEWAEIATVSDERRSESWLGELEVLGVPHVGDHVKCDKRTYKVVKVVWDYDEFEARVYLEYPK